MSKLDSTKRGSYLLILMLGLMFLAPLLIYVAAFHIVPYLHSTFVSCPPDCKEADFRAADLRRADLERADLTMANLCEADLEEANLQ